MITVRFSGLLRLDTGIRTLTLEAASVRELYERLPAAAEALRPGAGLTAEALSACVVLVNGRPAGGRARLRSGDEVTFLLPAGGG